MGEDGRTIISYQIHICHHKTQNAKEHHGDGNSYVVNLWGMLLGKQRDVMGNREVALRARAPRSLARLRVRRSRDYLVSHA